MALVPTPDSTQFPLSLHLNSKIPSDRALAIQRRALKQPKYVRIVDAEAGALCVVHDFERDEQLKSLQERRCKVIGLPFAERCLRDPNVWKSAARLPLYDLIFQSVVCCSGLSVIDRERCKTLVRWMGGTFSDELSANVELLVTARVSLHPQSKYQDALAQDMPIVCLSYLEAMWKAKAQVDISPHLVPALKGLAVCFDPLDGVTMDEYRSVVIRHGAMVEPLEKAEVVIVTDNLVGLYAEAKRKGILAGPPRWLNECFRLGRCLPISGDLEVMHPQAESLSVAPEDGGNDVFSAASEAECGICLLGCVICLTYVQAGKAQDIVKSLAWRCGAFTTLDPLDRAITHVVFKPVSPSVVVVSVPIEDDRVCFVDLSWLEGCACAGARVSVAKFPQQRVIYQPKCDESHARVLGRVPSFRASQGGSSTLSAANVATPQRPLAIASEPQGALSGPPAGAPAGAEALVRAQMETCKRTPPSADGVFKGLSIGVLPGSPEEPSVVEKICQNGGLAAHSALVPEAVAEARLDVCVCCDVSDPPILRLQNSAPLATVKWLDACVSDGTIYPQSAFPHFEPSNGALPVTAMQDCCVRITALEASAEGKRKRVHIEELATLVGARVLGPTGSAKSLTHVICWNVDLLDKKRHEVFVNKNVLVVTVQWLYDCFRMRARQPESQFGVGRSDGSPAGEGRVLRGHSSVQPNDSNFAATVLRGHNILISLAALGSNAQLPRMAEELGAVASTCSMDELRAELGARHASAPQAGPEGAAAQGPGGEGGRSRVVVLIDKEEARSASGAMAQCLASFPHEIFVLPSWLLETFSQRRVLPLEGFAAVPAADAAEAPAKRARLDEATYAWQSEASTRLAEFAEDSRLQELESKAKLKVSEGQRLAELRREPSRGA